MCETHRGDVDGVALLVKQISVDSAVDGASVERHHVLCQRAGLVGEDVLNLSQLFIERRRPRLRRSVGRRVVHLVVPVNPPAVSEPNHLHTDTYTAGSPSHILQCKGKGKGFPYSTPSVGPGADLGVQAVSPTVSHPAGGRI